MVSFARAPGVEIFKYKRRKYDGRVPFARAPGVEIPISAAGWQTKEVPFARAPGVEIGGDAIITSPLGCLLHGHRE